MLLVIRNMMKTANIFVWELLVQNSIFLNLLCFWYSNIFWVCLSDELYCSLHISGGCWLEVCYFYVNREQEYAKAVLSPYMYAATGTVFFSCWFFAQLRYLLANATFQLTCHISIHPSIHPSSSAYPGPGRGDSCLSWDTQTSLSSDTCSSFSGRIPRCSQASWAT